MKKLIGFIILLFFMGCQKLSPDVDSQSVNIQSENNLVLTQLDRNKISELFVVLFKEGLTSEDWKNIFKDTQRLSANKRQLTQIEGLMDEVSTAIRQKIIDENSVLLQRLTNSSVFIMNWTLADENCRFVFGSVLNMLCKPRNLDNPMNGGLPVQSGSIDFVTPDPIKDEIKTPYLSMFLSKIGDTPYDLQLRMKLESQTPTEFWFKGDVIPLKHSFDQHVYGYGYAELTTLRPL